MPADEPSRQDYEQRRPSGQRRTAWFWRPKAWPDQLRVRTEPQWRLSTPPSTAFIPRSTWTKRLATADSQRTTAKWRSGCNPMALTSTIVEVLPSRHDVQTTRTRVPAPGGAGPVGNGAA